MTNDQLKQAALQYNRCHHQLSPEMYREIRWVPLAECLASGEQELCAMIYFYTTWTKMSIDDDGVHYQDLDDGNHCFIVTKPDADGDCFLVRD